MNPNSQFISIDGGNTRLKVTLFPAEIDGVSGSAPEVRYFEAGDIEGLMEWIEEICREGEMPECAMAVVGHFDPRLAESLRNRLGEERFLLITSATPLPIGVRYATPHTLGLDRKAAACGAVALEGAVPMIIVDAGTALTIDRVDEAGNFNGGNISPGLKMRFRALHDFTAALPMIEEAPEDFDRFGRDTRSAIIAGVEGGWLDEIVAAIRRGRKSGVRKVLLCGGDAALLAALLAREEMGVEVKHMPHLVASGIRMIYDFNEK